MGGGRTHFMTETSPDPEYEGKEGKREDGRELTQVSLSDRVLGE